MPMWVRLKRDDIQLVNDCQVLPCDVDGHWDFFKTQRLTFIVNNVKKYIMHAYLRNKHIYMLKQTCIYVNHLKYTIC